MPTINQIIDKRKGSKKSFVKKEYRPYNMDKLIASEQEVAQPEKQDNTAESKIVKDVPVDGQIPGKQGEKTSVLEGGDEDVLSDRLNIAAPLKESKSLNLTPNQESFSVNHGFSTTLETSTEDALIQLSGRQKELLVLIIGNLIDNKSLVTSPIQSEKLIDTLGATAGTVKNTVRRLEAKGFIKSVSKRGRGGFYRFQSTEKVISAGQRLFFRP